MIAPTQVANTRIFAFITVPVFKLLSRKVLFINRKNNRISWFFKKTANFVGKLKQNYK